ncbi:hypothetical protein DFH27DRAFT_590196 [Peziza echinospora]|nr:hypothetical protein DFH27DRAFT_590196 [Peziza echinospora]
MDQSSIYFLPLANSNGHRLGVNSLAVDPAGILYSAGRDGLICSWDLGFSPQSQDESETQQAKSVHKKQVQAHTHWVNDIILTHNNQCVASCSSDLTVKLWRPENAFNESPQTIGHHSDYVKCLVAPRDGAAGWVASGGLDRKIRIWDLEGKGEILNIDVKDEGTNPKGSVYALAHGGGVLASGGPESIVRIWDPRTGGAVTKFVGHTDNIRAILVSEQGDYILTASSDTTIKLWSVAGARCLHTLSMHNDSVWSLFSSHPRLDIFHSSDRAGLVAKTDVRNVKEIDEGLCVAVCQEHEGVRKVVSSGNYIWTTTSSSGIKRWRDVDTNGEVVRPPVSMSGRPHAASTASARPRGAIVNPGMTRQPQIPIASILRHSSTSPLPTNVRDTDAVTIYSVTSARQASLSGVMMDGDTGITIPVNDYPAETIVGQDGLIKHFLLNDRRRVLTLDTAGTVVMWDLIRCKPIKLYGKRDLEDVAAEVNSVETVANWCQVDTRTGQLAVVLEENYCFDAEMYADDIDPTSGIEYRDDQRVNLGKWVLRYLFANLIELEIKNDEKYRAIVQRAKAERKTVRRDNAPLGIMIPETTVSATDTMPSSSTPRASAFPQTPNMYIGLATPGPYSHPSIPLPTDIPPNASTTSTSTSITTTAATDDESNTPIRTSMQAPSTDYFSTAPTNSASEAATSPAAVDPHLEATGGLFGKLRSFGSKKHRTDSVAANAAKIAAVADEAKPPSDTELVTEPVFDDTLGGMIKKMRLEYASSTCDQIPTKITPSGVIETPHITLPRNTAIIIQEDKPDSGGVADLYRGTVGGLGHEADVALLEAKAPAWLGDVLLLNKIPLKDTIKISFILQPWQDRLPSINLAQDTRLNANRMLRARRIMAYISERLPIEHYPEGAIVPPAAGVPTDGAPPKHVEPSLKPEDWLELLCHEQLVPMNMTLATLKGHVWKNAGDVMIYFRRKDWREVSERQKEPENATEHERESQPVKSKDQLESHIEAHEDLDGVTATKDD